MFIQKICDYLDGNSIVLQDYDPDYAKGHREGGTNKIIADDVVRYTVASNITTV